jgi:hypothetical protein
VSVSLKLTLFNSVGFSKQTPLKKKKKKSVSLLKPTLLNSVGFSAVLLKPTLLGLY